MGAELEELQGCGKTRDLANRAMTLFREPLTEEVAGQAKTLILDHLGVCLRGVKLPWGEGVARHAARHAGSGKALVVANGVRTAPAIAAMANATAAHGLEMDDTHDASISHPGAVVIAAALAIGHERGCSGDEMLRAIVAGYEVVARLGIATGARDIIAHGFHPTALFCGFGAAAAGALLMGFDEERLTRGWGLLLSTAGGSMQFSEDPRGTTVKRLHAGYGAHNGLLACELVVLGFDGPEDAFAGRYGLCRIFGRDPQLDQLSVPDGEAPEILNISIKPYPCCRLFHSTLDALSEVTDGYTLEPGHIESVRVGGPEIVVTQHMVRRPASVMAAQYNLPHIIAAALLHGPTAYEGYELDKLADPEILAISDRVNAEFSPEMEELFPARCGTWVEITVRDGSTRRAEVIDSLGTPRRPMGWDDVLAKTMALNDGLIDAANLSGIAGLVAELGPEVSLATLVDALSKTATQSAAVAA